MKAKHTPGPWAVETPMGDDILCIMQEGKAINVATWVAQIGLGKESECDPGYDEAHANAAIISAAPELLAQLIYLVDAGYESGWHRSTLSEARAAIAKAQGE